jgi:hypothetical protein
VWQTEKSQLCTLTLQMALAVLLALPRGYWVSLDEIRRDLRWCGRKARPMKIAVSEFLVFIQQNGAPIEQWIELKRGQYIQGAVAQIHWTRRVYVVTVDPPERYIGAKPFWPRVVEEPRVSLDRDSSNI